MELNLLKNLFNENEDFSDIDHSFESVIEIDFDNFILEYNQTNNIYKAIPKDKENFDDIILEGSYIDENENEIIVCFDKDIDLFGYLLTVEEFNNIKQDLKNI